MKANELISRICNFKSISIIGMEKNSGKTTTLNYILKKLNSRKIIGLTSIGRDGEDNDLVTNTHKPRIYVEKGTLIATAKNLLNKCDITREILYTTGLFTPLGEVIIVRAKSDGYVDIGGPSYGSAIIEVRDKMLELGADIILIDGALSRKGSANTLVSEATILATGASFSPNMKNVVTETSHNIDMLQLPHCEPNIKKLADQILEIGKIGFIDNEFNIKVLDLSTSLNSHREIIDAVRKNFKYLVIGGAISSSMIEAFIKNRVLLKNFILIIEDGTRIFIDSNVYSKLSMIPVKIQVLNKINLLCLTSNPISPYGYSFDSLDFQNSLKKATNLDVIDVEKLEN